MSITSLGIFSIVEQARLRFPERAALEFEGQSWTWDQLYERVRKLAGGLAQAGVGEGTRIAFLDKNHPACLETTLAASLLGAAHAVVNFRLAAPELTYVINDSTATVLIVGYEFLPLLAEIQSGIPSVERVIVLGGPEDEYEAFLAAAQPLQALRTADPEDCFLQLYTSGTTGFPKGAMLTQRSIAAHNAGIVPAYAMDETTVNLVAMPLFHVGGTSWALGSMSAGARTIIAREVVPGPLLKLIVDQQITHAFLVPAVIQMLLAQDNVVEATARLQVLGYGGSPMPGPLMAQVLATLSTPMYSVYGMTELSGVFCVLGPQDHRRPERRHLLASAGRPLPGSEVRVVDPASGETVQDGVVGEFWVRSAQAMKGYWNKPEATADAFVDGWLRTGDAGRMDSEGYLFLEDRVKDMVITGGENVYPAEVERVLVTHPDVAEAAVIGTPHEKWGETVHAVVVLTADADIEAQELITFTRQHLAHYKCPTGITFLTELPRNPTGKILKKDLRTALR